MPRSTDAGTPRLREAMRYSTLGGGKRLRPALVYLTGESLGAALTDLDAPAAAVELIHVYSSFTMTYRRWTTMICAAADQPVIVHMTKPRNTGGRCSAGTGVFGARGRRAGKHCAAHPSFDDPNAGISGWHNSMAGGQAVDLAAVGQTLSVDAVREHASSQDGRPLRQRIARRPGCRHRSGP